METIQISQLMSCTHEFLHVIALLVLTVSAVGCIKLAARQDLSRLRVAGYALAIFAVTSMIGLLLDFIAVNVLIGILFDAASLRGWFLIRGIIDGCIEVLCFTAVAYGFLTAK